MKSTLKQFRVLFLMLTSVAMAGALEPVWADDASAITQALDALTADIQEEHPVENLSVQDLTIDQAVVLFDVREMDEFRVSHLSGALQLDPDLSAEDFFAQYANVIKDKTVVFYCSVGLRSSRMLERVEEDLPDAGVTEAFNLKGGIFEWHNNELPLVKQTEVTRQVHPYNRYFSRYLIDRDAVVYQP